MNIPIYKKFRTAAKELDIPTMSPEQIMENRKQRKNIELTQTCNGLNLTLCIMLGNPKFALAQVARRDGTSALDHATSSLLRYQGKKNNKRKQDPKRCYKNVKTTIAIIAGHGLTNLNSNICLKKFSFKNFKILPNN